MSQRSRAEAAPHPRLEGVEVLRVAYPPGTWPATLHRPRDRALALMCARGLSVAQMAEERGLAVQTLTNELSALYRKLGTLDRNAFLAKLYGASDAEVGGDDDPGDRGR